MSEYQIQEDLLWVTSTKETDGAVGVNMLHPFVLNRDKLLPGRYIIRAWCLEKRHHVRKRNIQIQINFSGSTGELISSQSLFCSTPKSQIEIEYSLAPHLSPASLTISATSSRFKMQLLHLSLHFSPHCISTPASMLPNEEFVEKALAETTYQTTLNRIIEDPTRYQIKAIGRQMLRPFLLTSSMDALLRMNMARILKCPIQAAKHDPHYEAFLMLCSHNRHSLCSQSTSAKQKFMGQYAGYRDLLLMGISWIRAKVAHHTSLSTYQTKARKENRRPAITPLSIEGTDRVTHIGSITRPLQRKALKEKYIYGMNEIQLENLFFSEMAAYQQTMVIAAIETYERTNGTRLKFKLKPWRIQAGRLIRTEWQLHPRIQFLFELFKNNGLDDPDIHLYILELAVKSHIDFTGNSPEELREQIRQVDALTANELADIICEGRMFGMRSRIAYNKRKLITDYLISYTLSAGLSAIPGSIYLCSLLSADDTIELLSGKPFGEETAAAILVYILTQRIALIGQGIDFEAAYKMVIEKVGGVADLPTNSTPSIFSPVNQCVQPTGPLFISSTTHYFQQFPFQESASSPISVTTSNPPVASSSGPIFFSTISPHGPP